MQSKHVQFSNLHAYSVSEKNFAYSKQLYSLVSKISSMWKSIPALKVISHINSHSTCDKRNSSNGDSLDIHCPCKHQYLKLLGTSALYDLQQTVLKRHLPNTNMQLKQMFEDIRHIRQLAICNKILKIFRSTHLNSQDVSNMQI